MRPENNLEAGHSLMLAHRPEPTGPGNAMGGRRPGGSGRRAPWTGSPRPSAPRSTWALVGVVCAALVAAVLPMAPSAGALAAAPAATSGARRSVPAPGASARIPAGLQAAIHRALGPGPIGLGTAPLVSGIEASSSGWSALAPRQGLSATVSRSGSLEVSLRGTGRTRARGSLAPRSVSTAAHGPATALRARSSYLVAGRLVQDMGLVSTSYQVTPAGLEQSFTVSRPPSGPGGGLVIDLGPAGGWAVAADGSSLVERGPAAPTSLVYGGLRTTDAQGAVLASQLRVAGGTVEIVVHGAGRGAYPVVIDPTWSSSSSPTATLTSSNSSPAFGYSVAMSADGTTALVGAPVANSFHGAAYVFNVSDEGSWANSSAATATLTNLGDAANDWFGSSVALSGDGTTALVGAFGVSSGTGAAYVFNVPSEASWTTSWTPTVTLTNGLSGGWFGLSVAMSFYGTTALIGGATGAYVFNVPNEASWASSSSPTATLAKPGGSTYDSSGYSVAMSADGTTALIGDADANAAVRVQRRKRSVLGVLVVHADGHPGQFRRLER